MKWNYDPRLDPINGTRLTFCDDCERWCQDFFAHDCDSARRSTAPSVDGDTKRVQSCENCGHEMGSE